MPPKRKVSSRVRGRTTEQFEYPNSIATILNHAACSSSNAFGEILAEGLKAIKQIINNGQKYSNDTAIDHLHVGNLIASRLEEDIVQMLTMKSSISKKETLKNTGKCEINSPARTLTSLKDSRFLSPTITAETTDEEMEDVQIPNTAICLQKLSITRSNVISTPKNGNTPKRFCRREEFQSPSRNVRAMGERNQLVFGPTEPVTENKESMKEMEIKERAKHAAQLKQYYLQEKVEKAKCMEEKRKEVQKRREEKEKERMNIIEKKRKKELEVAEFAKANYAKSPSRNVLPPRTPLKTINNSSSTNGGTPSRRLVKPRLANKETTGKPAANPNTETLSSRNVPKVVSKELPKKERKILSVTKAKKIESVPKSMKDHSSTARKDDQNEKLRQEQEAYLMKVAEEKTKREAEEQKRRLAEEEEARRQVEEEENRRRIEEEEQRMLEEQKREEEAAKLRKLQEEQEEKLRKEATEQGKKAQKVADEKKLAPEKVKLVTTYEMTPPRVYVAKSKHDYGLDDLNSDDETDQEDDPRKCVPAWADFNLVRNEVRKHYMNPPFVVDKFFREIPVPNLKVIVGEQARIKKRTSSAVWKSPMSTY